MGNYKFRLSDMIPNAWFYKLRDMNKPNKTHNKKLPSSTPRQKPRNSVYYTTTTSTIDSVFNSPRNSKFSDTNFPIDPPRKSSKKPKRKTIYYKPTTKQVTSFSDDSPNSSFSKPESTQFQDYAVSSVNTSPEPDPDHAESLTWSSSCSCRVSSSATDIIIDVNEKSYSKRNPNSYGFDPISETELPPILTKPVKLEQEKEIKNPQETPVSRKSVSHYSGVKIRANSPRIASKKVPRNRSSNTRSRQKKERICDSFAIVKSSFDPQKDFRESMMEMIIENNIRASKDLEELLACYLSLNSDEYHDLIVKAFEQIWFKMPNLNV